MSASLGWDPKRRLREEKEALEQLRKQKEGVEKLRSGLGRRKRPVTDEREPALEEKLKEKWKAEVGEAKLIFQYFLRIKVGDNSTVLSHWQLERLVKEAQPLLTEQQLMRWVLLVSLVVAAIIYVFNSGERESHFVKERTK